MELGSDQLCLRCCNRQCRRLLQHRASKWRQLCKFWLHCSQHWAKLCAPGCQHCRPELSDCCSLRPAASAAACSSSVRLKTHCFHLLPHNFNLIIHRHFIMGPFDSQSCASAPFPISINQYLSSPLQQAAAVLAHMSAQAAEHLA